MPRCVWTASVAECSLRLTSLSSGSKFAQMLKNEHGNLSHSKGKIPAQLEKCLIVLSLSPSRKQNLF